MQPQKPMLRGLKDGLPICLGYFAVSFAFGIQAAAAGLTPLQAGLLSLTNLTSAGQFAGLGVILQSGSYLEMAFVQLVINLRYLLMSAALSQKLSPATGTPARMGVAFGVTDEIFAVSIGQKGLLDPRYSYALTAISTLGWTLGTVLGATAGAILPAKLTSALGVALYGMFIAVFVPPAFEKRSVAAAVLGAMALSTLLTYTPGLRAISGGMRIILVTVLVAAFCAWRWPVKEGE